MIVAPFLGEFGWEVALWVPWLRWMRRHVYSTEQFTVFCPHGHEHLYEDFATKVVKAEVPKVERRDCQNAWFKGSRFRPEDYFALLRSTGVRGVGKMSVITPHSLQVSWPIGECPRPTSRSEPRAYCEGTLRKDRIVFHVRNSKQHTERNWIPDDAEMVGRRCIEIGYEVVCVGSKDSSYDVDWTMDLRGIPLADLCSILAGSRVIVGPSSGPMHLANFCGTPAVWWSGNEKDLARYETHWNPFRCQNNRVEKTWDPRPEQVLDVLAVHLHKQGLKK